MISYDLPASSKWPFDILITLKRRSLNLRKGHLNPQKGHLEEAGGCLGYIGDYTSQLCGDYFIKHYKDPY